MDKNTKIKRPDCQEKKITDAWKRQKKKLEPRCKRQIDWRVAVEEILEAIIQSVFETKSHREAHISEHESESHLINWVRTEVNSAEGCVQYYKYEQSQ